MSTAIIAMTTSNSIRVNARRLFAQGTDFFIFTLPFGGNGVERLDTGFSALGRRGKGGRGGRAVSAASHESVTRGFAGGRRYPSALSSNSIVWRSLSWPSLMLTVIPEVPGS